MSKELTEQWRNGTLKCGWYFLKFENGSTLPVYYCEFNREFEFKWTWKISEVLSPANYNQFVDLTEKVEDLEQDNKCLKSGVNTYESQLSRISEQLKEANEVIKFYANIDGMTEEEKQMTAEKYHLVYGLKACDYLERYGVK